MLDASSERAHGGWGTHPPPTCYPTPSFVRVCTDFVPPTHDLLRDASHGASFVPTLLNDASVVAHRSAERNTSPFDAASSDYGPVLISIARICRMHQPNSEKKSSTLIGKALADLINEKRSSEQILIYFIKSLQIFSRNKRNVISESELCKKKKKKEREEKRKRRTKQYKHLSRSFCVKCNLLSLWLHSLLKNCFLIKLPMLHADKIFPFYTLYRKSFFKFARGSCCEN